MKTKRFLSMVLAIVLTVSLFVGITGTASADNEIINYTVKSGDYIYKICNNNGLTYSVCKDAIKLLNGFTSDAQFNRIYPGQTLKLPASDAIAATVKTQVVVGTSTSSSSSAAASTTSSTAATVSSSASGDTVAFYLVPHKVVSGETLAKICAALNTSYSKYANKILTINGLSSVTRIYAGKTIFIPVDNKPASGTYYTVVAHKVNAGETMTSICNAYGINYSSNMALVKGLNDGYNMNFIKVGQVVYVPTTKTVDGGGSSTDTTKFDISIIVSGTGMGDAASPYAVVNGVAATKAAQGDTVTIKSSDATTATLKIVKVQRYDTKATIDFDADTDSFTMPKCGAVVTVVYEDGYAINKKVVGGHGSFETYVNNEVASFAAEGKKVYIKFVPNSGYIVDSVSVQDASSNTVELKKDAAGSKYFVMPKNGASITVSFKEATYYSYTLKYLDEDGKETKTLGTAELTVDDTVLKAKGISAGTIVAVEASPVNGYGVQSIKYKNEYGVMDDATMITDTMYSFEMPDNDTEIEVTFVRTQEYNIYSSNTLGLVKYKTLNAKGRYVNTTTAKAGETVYFAVSNANYYKVSIKKITYAKGTSKVNFTTTPNADGYYEFVMPAADVTVKIKAQADYVRRYVVYADTTSASFDTFRDNGDGTLTASSTFSVGQTVIIKAKDKSGYTPKYYCRLTYNGLTKYVDITDTATNTGKVKMFASEGGLPIYVSYVRNNQQIAYINATVSENAGTKMGTLKVLSHNSEIANSNTPTVFADTYLGTEVTFKVTPAKDKDGELYELHQLLVYYDGIAEENVDLTTVYLGGYTIPKEAQGKNVTFEAVFAPADSYVVSTIDYEDAVVTADKEYAKKGETVTVTVDTTESEGTIVPDVVSVGGTPITLKTHVPGTYVWTYEFTMKADDALVSVTFKDAEYSLKAKATVGTATATFSVDGSATTTANPGDEVTIEVVPGSGEVMKAVLITNPENKSEQLDITSSLVDGKYTFKMPAFDVTAELKSEVPVMYALSKNVYDDVSGDASVHYEVNGTTVTQAYEGQIVTVIINPGTDQTVKIAKITDPADPSKKIDVTSSVSGNKISFTMIGHDVETDISVEKRTFRALNANVEDDTLTKVHFEVSGSEVTRAYAGQTVTLVLEPGEEKALKKVTITDLVDSSKVTNITDDIADNKYTFVMPDYEVEVKVTTDVKTYALSVNKSNCKIQVDGSDVTSAAKGETVKVLVPNTKTIKTIGFKTGTPEGTSNSEIEGYHVWSFTMPAQDVEIVISYK